MFIHGPEGRLVLPGPSIRQREFLLWDEASTAELPPWLTVSAGTATFFRQSTGGNGFRGAINLTTGAVSGNNAKIQMSHAFDLSQFLAVYFEVDQWQIPSTADFDVTFGVLGTSVGAAVQQLVADSAATLYYNGIANGYNRGDLNLRGKEGRMNLGIAIFPGQVTLYMGTGGILNGYKRALWSRDITTPALTRSLSSMVTPSIEIITRTAAARAMNLAGVRVALVY